MLMPYCCFMLQIVYHVISVVNIKAVLENMSRLWKQVGTENPIRVEFHPYLLMEQWCVLATT